ncbi:conserved hypothetical protein [Hyella patelloides LEGE 07179]|uniref:Malectin domain-containing protein n=1 Tax=Hyella patelloides LEGE 07179 TaxID=945734 RepID=A0A563W118_9CYAN|nr:malectin domain-containing carbohydrate-binding protein [Hyella patelloides]VEP17378.1 conserved hypothetical protein [Hyella patelloides LEGE 07179]
MAIDIQQIRNAGISQRATDYINNLNADRKEAVLQDEAMEDTINAINATDSVPEDAIEITTADRNAASQIENGQGKTFVLRGNLNFNKTLRIPNDVTIYVDGTITKNGSHSADFYDDENTNDSVDAVFRVDDRSNVKLIGVNNAKLVSNQRATGVYIEGSDNVEVRGFDIGNVWEGVVAHWGNNDVKIFNNYIHDTGKRAIWSLGSDGTEAAHNFIENAGGDGFDWDAYATGNVAYENVVVGWRRWAGFVEEGAQDSYFAKNMAIMAEFEYKHPDPNNVPDSTQYTMGWADNGTTPGINRLTQNNYFIGNTLFKPSSYTRRKSGGDYFAKRNQQGKGKTYFWGNKGNVGFALNSNSDVPDSQQNPQDSWYQAEFAPTVAPGQSTLDKFENLFPVFGSSQEPIRINAGGEAFTDESGNQWSADRFSQGGQLYATTAGIDSTRDDPLLQTERFGQNFSYAIPVENGNYQVNLGFAEIYWNESNQRIFDLEIENELVIDDLDIYAEAGGKNEALEKSFSVEVQDGTLNLDFSTTIDSAKISTIEVVMTP